MTVWELSDDINQDDLPVAVRNMIFQELSSQWGQEGLSVVAQVITLHVLCHIMTPPWPPEIAGNQVCSFPLARMTSNWRVMVGLYYVMSELAIGVDIDPSLIEY